MAPPGQGEHGGAPKPKKRRNPLAVAVGICAGVTLGGIVIKARRGGLISKLPT